MRMLMPSHAKYVHQYKDGVPVFQRMHIESQLDSMFSPTVTLKSGGYIVINQTEALVSIDVNSGRATREHSIEETARKTNLEAASEIGRQLRLRDLAGLIVIDFIDMEDSRNDREVERRLRDAVKNDRARVQIGKISQFGLLEMSRQRLRAGVIAGSTVTCPHCAGTGLVRSVESTALRVLRGLEEEGEKSRAAAVIVKVSGEVALYILNQKRSELTHIEAEHGMAISFDPKEGLAAGSFEIERTKNRDPGERPRASAVGIEAGFVTSDEPEPEYQEEVEEEEAEEAEEPSSESEEAGESENTERQEGGQRDGRGGRRRRRRGGRGRGRERGERGEAPQSQDAGISASSEAAQIAESDQPEEGQASAQPESGQQDGQNGQQLGENGDGARRRRRRRRGRRGGRDREDRPQTEGMEHHQTGFTNESDRFGAVPDEIDTTPTVHAPGLPSTPVWSLKDDTPDTTPSDRAGHGPALPSSDEIDTTPQDDGKPKKKGWWQRTFSNE
jgi:ribonuclease E